MYSFYIRALWLTVCGSLLSFCSANAQRLALSRGDDNFRALSLDSLHRATQLPGLKALYFDQAKRYFIGFGGEIRQQLQVFSNESWGERHTGQIETNDGVPFLLQRYMLNANLQLGSHLRVFGELKSMFENGRKTGPRPQIDEDQLDVHQLFADITINPTAKTQTVLRLGRQELNYGASRVVSLNEGPNTRLTFQGVKFMLNSPTYFVHVFYTNPVSNNRGVFDDKREKDVTLWGAYTNWKLPLLAQTALDVYALGYQKKEATYVNGEADEHRYTAGFRWYRLPAQAIDFDLEVNFQTGTFGSNHIRAFSVVANLGYEFEETPWKPSVHLIGSAYSGDRGRSTTLGTFNPLFPRVYLGLGVPVFPSNLINLSPVVEVHPTKQLALIGDVHALWRYSTADGLYGEGQLVRQPYLLSTKVASSQSFIGMQYDLTAEYNFTTYFGMAFYATLFPAGAYLRETGASQTIGWSLLQAKWRF